MNLENVDNFLTELDDFIQWFQKLVDHELKEKHLTRETCTDDELDAAEHMVHYLYHREIKSIGTLVAWDAADARDELVLLRFGPKEN